MNLRLMNRPCAKVYSTARCGEGFNKYHCSPTRKNMILTGLLFAGVLMTYIYYLVLEEAA